MTLSRRDEFAARAMESIIGTNCEGSPSDFAEVSRKFADALIAELDRTAPKEAAPEVVDDGREISDKWGFCPEVERDREAVIVRVVDGDDDGCGCRLTPDDAAILALRLQKAAAKARKA